MCTDLAPKLLTVGEFATHLGISRQTVYTWIRRKKIAVVRIDGTKPIRIAANQLPCSAVEPQHSPE